MPTSQPITLLADSAPSDLIGTGAWNEHVSISAFAEGGQTAALSNTAGRGLGVNTLDGVVDNGQLIDTSGAGQEGLALDFSIPVAEVSLDLGELNKSERVRLRVYDEDENLISNIVYEPGLFAEELAPRTFRFTVTSDDIGGLPIGRVEVASADGDGAKTGFALLQASYTPEEAAPPPGAPITLSSESAPDGVVGVANWDANLLISADNDSGATATLANTPGRGLGVNTLDDVLDNGFLIDTTATGSQERLVLDFVAPVASVSLDLGELNKNERVRLTVYDADDAVVSDLVYEPGLAATEIASRTFRFTLDSADLGVDAIGRVDLASADSDGGKTGFALLQASYTPAGSVAPTPTPGVDGVYQAEDAVIEGPGIAVESAQAGFNGTGYVDYAADAGESLTFAIEAEASGVFTLAWRYALSSGDRPLALTVNGVVVDPSLSFDATGSFSTWGEVSATAFLNEGLNTVTLASVGASGANIDEMTVTEAGADLFSAKVNFQTSGAPTPVGYAADFGGAFDADRGYGWVAVGGSDPLDKTADASKRNEQGVDPRLDTLVHFEKGAEGAWEYALENGRYAVTVSVGDGAFTNSVHVVNAEGVELLPAFDPADPALWTLSTGVVEVTDGLLTLDSVGGANTKINYVEIVELPDLPLTAIAGSDPEDRATDIATDVALSFDVSLQQLGGNVDENSLSGSTVTLYETRSGEAIPAQANTTAGGDSITLTPSQALDPNTHYTVRIDGVADLNGDPVEPFSTTFTTGEDGGPIAGDELQYETITVATDIRATSLAISPDGQFLYAATLTGELVRWTLDAETGELSNKQVDQTYLGQNIIGLEFRPGDSSELWITRNDTIFEPGEAFTGEVVKVSIPDGPAFNPEYQVYLTGLPRSTRDHLANSLEFGPDGMLYMTQGSNTATGEADPAWGLRDERLLSAAVLQIDPDREPPAGGFDVQTDVADFDPAVEGDQSTPTALRNPDGSVPGFYNPFAEDAVVKIYGAGVRNAYDLVWTSDGRLFVPTNGSAAGGYIPDDPDQPGDQSIEGAVTLNDYLFDVEEGGYYGHPNQLLDYYVLNGGNPTAGVDPGEVVTTNPNSGFVGYDVGVQPEENYRGFAWDFGAKVSPNGVIEVQTGPLAGSLLVAEYSKGDGVRVLRRDENGDVIDGSETLQQADGGLLRFSNPLDLVEDTRNGNIYVSSFSTGPANASIVLLKPTVDGTPPQTGQTVSLTADASLNNVTAPTLWSAPDDAIAVTIAAYSGVAAPTKLKFFGDDNGLAANTLNQVSDNTRFFDQNDGAQEGFELTFDQALERLTLDLTAIDDADRIRVTTFDADGAEIASVVLNQDVQGAPFASPYVNAARFEIAGAGIRSAIVETEAGVDGATEFGLAGIVARTDDGGTPVPGADGDVQLTNPEQLVLDAPRLVFNAIKNLDENGLANNGKTYRTSETATLEISNTGDGALTLLDLDLSGPFEFVDPSDDQQTVLNPGQSLSVEVLFTPLNTGRGIQTGALTVTTDDPDEGTLTVDLAGWNQNNPEGGGEPSVLENAELFGLTTDFGLPGEIEAGFDDLDPIGDEVVSAFWTQADSAQQIEVTQFGAWTAPRDYSFSIYDPDAITPEAVDPTDDAGETLIFSSETIDSQTVRPRLEGSSAPAGGAFDAADPFGIVFEFNDVKDYSDNSLNANDDRLVRFFSVRDDAGDIVENEYFVLHDYNSVNYDYNDNYYHITNVMPFMA